MEKANDWGLKDGWGWRDGRKTCTEITERIVRLAPHCGFNEITLRTVDDVWTRVRLWLCLYEQVGHLKRQDIADHVGIYTSNYALSNHQFLRHLWNETRRILLMEKD